MYKGQTKRPVCRLFCSKLSVFKYNFELCFFFKFNQCEYFFYFLNLYIFRLYQHTFIARSLATCIPLLINASYVHQQNSFLILNFLFSIFHFFSISHCVAFVVHKSRGVTTLSSLHSQQQHNQQQQEPLVPARLRQSKEKSNIETKADERGL